MRAHFLTRPALALPLIVLAACGAPALQSSGGAPEAAAPFTMPMDPGLIRCEQLSNPTALEAATQWALGRARAAALAGTIAGIPDTATLSGNLAAYCRSNRGETIRTATAQLGGILN